jgi:hypothetical protein
MVLVHGMLSLLMIFPVVSLAAGDWRQALFLLWWLIGTAALAVLVYSSVTFSLSPRRLPVWQVLGLVVGILLSLPLIFGFTGEWWASLSAVLASCTAAFILICATRNRPAPNKTLHATAAAPGS